MESVKSGGAALIEPGSTGVKDTEILIQSIWHDYDLCIGIAAVAAAACLVFCLCLAWCVKEKCSKRLNFFVHLTNNIFVTLTSLFPQLGLFGTVRSLMKVKFDSLDLDNVLPQFFNALTSTAWGIIFFVVFSVAYALCSFFIEAKIEEGKRLVDASEVKS